MSRNSAKPKPQAINDEKKKNKGSKWIVAKAAYAVKGAAKCNQETNPSRNAYKIGMEITLTAPFRF